MDKEQIYEQIRLAGYNYAKELFRDWRNIWDNEEDFRNSLNENGIPKENTFSETVGESSYHNYCSGNNDDFFEFFEISGVSQEGRKSVEDDELYDILDEGITKFINETYHKC
jgi:hypothetical protein